VSPLDVVYRDNGVPVGYACSLPRIPQRVLKLSCLSTREILSLLHYLHHAIDVKPVASGRQSTHPHSTQVRKGYTSVAYSTQVLFFCIACLENIEPVYSYSLVWFINLFVASIKNSETASDVPTRLDNLYNHFIYSLYKNICRSLLEKDKLLFSFVLTIRILQGKNELDDAEWLFFLTGGVSLDNPHKNPAQDWLAPKLWNEICLLDAIPAFRGLREHVDRCPHQWRTLYDSTDPQEEPLPDTWDKLTGLKRLCVLRCVRPDKVVLGVQKFVISEMGEKFVRPPPFDLQACYDESSCIQPLVFVLAPGSDPMASVLEAAEAIGREVEPISLGQGQGPVAEALIARACKVHGDGSWVVLQNCSWRRPSLHLQPEAARRSAGSWDDSPDAIAATPSMTSVHRFLHNRSPRRVVHAPFRGDL
tara:strand:- start:1784 stop:3040 length:1257 start_codon:yes stop_codon:yes gene_type:complete